MGVLSSAAKCLGTWLCPQPVCSLLSMLSHLIQLVSELRSVLLLPPVMELPLVWHLLGVALSQVGVFVLKPTPPLPC